MPSAGQSKQVGERFLRTPTLDVIYYPKVGVAECCEVADQLTMLLRDITTPEGTSSIAPTANGPLRRASCMCW